MAVAGRTEAYTYTAPNRLQGAAGIWDSLTVGYDGVGNRTSEVLVLGGTTTSTYNYPRGSNLLSVDASAHLANATRRHLSQSTSRHAFPRRSNTFARVRVGSRWR